MLKVNGTEHDFSPGTTLAQLLDMMNYPAARVAVERNGEIVPRRQFSNTLLNDFDVLEVVSFVGGG